MARVAVIRNRPFSLVASQAASLSVFVFDAGSELLSSEGGARRRSELEHAIRLKMFPYLKHAWQWLTSVGKDIRLEAKSTVMLEACRCDS